jgi:hypothetical protein
VRRPLVSWRRRTWETFALLAAYGTGVFSLDGTRWLFLAVAVACLTVARFQPDREAR